MRVVTRASVVAMALAALVAVQARAQTAGQAQAQAVVQAPAPTADEVVEKHLAAIGGRAALGLGIFFVDEPPLSKPRY